MLTIWILCSLLCLLGFVNKKKIIFNLGEKQISFTIIYGLIIYFFLIILMTSNDTGYDSISFIRFFEYTKTAGINIFDYTYESLFRVQLFTLRFLPNLTYQEFHAIVLMITGVFCIYPFLKKYSIDPITVISLYVLSGVFASDGMQFKNFISVCLLILSLCFYSNDEHNILNTILFYIILVVAILFHFSFALYLILPLFRIKKLEKGIRYFPMIGGAIYISINFLLGKKMLISIISNLARVQFLSKAEDYSTGTTGIRSIVPVTIYYIVLFVLCFLNEKDFDLNKCKKDNKKNNVMVLVSDVRRIWMVMGAFLPLLSLANATYRLYRNLYIPIFTVLVNSIIITKDKRKKNISIVLVIIMAFIIFIYPILLRQQGDIYQPVIEGKWFWIEK